MTLETYQRSDAELVARCQKGDHAAFDDLVRQYKDCVYNVVYRLLGHHEEALDVAQEVFVRAFRGIAEFQSQANVATWLYRIAVNTARNRLRDMGRKGRGQGLSLEALRAPSDEGGRGFEPEARGETPRDTAERHELDEHLQNCLDELPAEYRETFVLRVFEDLTYEEIAEALDCPLGTVKSRIHQARGLLRQRLEARAVL